MEGFGWISVKSFTRLLLGKLIASHGTWADIVEGKSGVDQTLELLLVVL